MVSLMMRNKIYYFHHVLVVCFVFLMLCMETILLSSASELVSNKTMVNNKCIETERHALLDIKRGLVDIHGRLSSWGSSQEEENCCQWSGVGCDHHTGHVTHLHLSHLNYYMERDIFTNSESNISSSLLHLRNLKYLDLSDNVFGGDPIPSFIGSLTNLVYLNLSDSCFLGAIPDELGNLSKLNYLDLSFNSFDSNPFPKSIASLTSLTYLDLSINHFIFSEFPHQLGNLSKLRYLDLSRNNNLMSIGSLESDSIDWLFHLSSLTYLDMSEIFIGTVNFNDWVSLIYKLPSLSVLRLTECNLSSVGTPSSSFTNSSPPISVLHLSQNQLDISIFDWISNLSVSLVDLDLSFNQLHGNIPKSFSNMAAITNLDLSYNNLEGIVPTNSLFHIVTLKLFKNNFTSTIFDWVSKMSTTLVNLDLSDNMMQGQIPDNFSMGSLINLDLSDNLLQGRIPNSFGVMSDIAYLDLSSNQLEGMIPNSFHNLSSLQFVDFSLNNLTGNLQDLLYLLPEATLQILSITENQLTGSLPDITKFSFLKELYVDSNQLNGYLPKQFENKSVLRTLLLSNNYLHGSLPNFTGFLFLENLHLNDNKFSGSLPDFTGCSSLQILQLSGNQFTKWETKSIGQLTNLDHLDLSRNSINSTIDQHHLSKLYSLRGLDASFNSLTFNLSSEWLPPFNLVDLSLASCKLGPKFPSWIQNQKNIESLDFSNNQISDTIPMWLWDESYIMLHFLDLSSNKIRGTLSSVPLYHAEIDLSSNNIEGPLPQLFSGCTKINLSQNKFSGKLLSPFEYTILRFIDLSQNLLFGELPDSWIYFTELVFLDLGHNNFSGRIPMSIGYLVSLQTLNLRNNSFYGEVPESLRNCTNLGFVDFGLNSLSGNVPTWIGQDLPQLYALILKSNKFYGSMPYDLCHLSDLRFLDLSMNRISGNVPQCFSNLTAMVKHETGITVHDVAFSRGGFIYLDDALAIWKGMEREYGRNFAYLKMIDLSSNELTGEIPIGITRLLDLNGLNLSRNKFYGKVPVEMDRLFQLEVLDLSSNKFSGEIPQSMSGLTFLSYLDLSSNNFSGRIPLGNQLQLFNSSTYDGNPGLCGLPLTKRCPGDETNVVVQPPSNGNEVDEDEIIYKRWLYISTALGFSTTFWGICVTLLLNRRWRHAYFMFLTNLKDQLYVFMVVRIARLKARLQG